MRLNGRTALVTGAAGGIGAATASRLVKEGASVVVADVDIEGGTATAERIGARFLPLDVTSAESWAELTAQLPQLDIVHLNAGVMSRPRGAAYRDKALDWLDEAIYDRVFDVNVKGVLLGILALRPVLERGGGGKIVVTASTSAMSAQAEDPIYCASKHAVVGLVRSLGEPLSRQGIWINAVCPGPIDTELVPSDIRGSVALSHPDYIAEAVMRLLAKECAGTIWIAYGEGYPFYEYIWPATKTRLDD